MRLIFSALALGLAGLSAAGDPKIKEVDAKGLLAAVKEQQAKVVVVNFYATWCPPCVAEFPHFVKFRQASVDRGVEVLFMSADFPDDKDKVFAFLKQRGVDWQSFLKAGKDGAFIKAINPDWTGALPATAFYSNTGKQLKFHHGVLSLKELTTTTEQLLKRERQKQEQQEKEK